MSKAAGDLLQPGARVDQFEVLRLLGRGGAAEVYLARDTTLGRKVALKLLLRHEAAAALREARATARVVHPNIVQIFALGSCEGRPYLALELIAGQSLRQRLDRGLTGAEAPRLALALAEALRAAHARQVVHGDLKPENVLIDDRGAPRVVDFGLVADGVQRLRGTPAYMAPEQWRGELGSAVDVWAFGVLLHELLLGRRPWPDADHQALRAAVTGSDPLPLDALPTGTLGELVRSCLVRDGTRRPDASALVATLEPLVRDAARAGEGCPFPGLRPFGAAERLFFCGREEEIDHCVEQLHHEARLALVGPSGVGKSSLLAAGVLPRLADEGWARMQLRPGGEPMRRLAAEVLRAQGAAPDPDAARELAATLTEAPALLALLLERLAAARRANVVLAVDALEELVAGDVAPPERASFVAALESAGDDVGGPLRLLVAARDDSLGQLATTAAAGRLLARVVVLRGPDRPALRQIVRDPLRRRGYACEDEALEQQLVAGVAGEAASLPLLQFALRRLWEARDRQRRVITRAAFERLGGVAGALATHADALIAGFSAADARRARAILSRLVTADGRRRAINHDELLEGLDPGAAAVVARLTRERLLTAGKSDDGSPATVELTHESLVERWPRLGRWLRDDQLQRAVLQEVERAASLWHERGRREEELWPVSSLAEAERHLVAAEAAGAPPSSAARAFFAAARRRGRGRRRLLLAALVPALLAAALLFCWAWPAAPPPAPPGAAPRRSPVSRWAALRVAAAERAADAGRWLEARAELRAALEVAESRRARGLWWRLSRGRRRPARPLAGAVRRAASSGQQLLALQARGVELLGPATRRRLPEDVPSSRGQQLAVGGDGRRAAIAGGGQLLLWDLERGSVRRRPLRRASALALSARGDRLAVATADRRLELWDARRLERRRALAVARRVDHLAFGGGGRWLVSGGAPGPVQLWAVGGGQLTPARLLRGPRRAVRAVAVAGGGEVVAAADDRGAVFVWDRPAGGRLLPLVSHPGLRALALSRNGSWLATGDGRGEVRVWSTSDGVQRELYVLRPSAPTMALAISRRGVTSLDARGGVHRFRLGPEEGLAVARGHRGAVLDVALGAAGQLASAGADATVRLWRADGAEVVVLRGHQGAVARVAFSGDGRLLASGGRDGTVRLWDPRRLRARGVLDAGGALLALAVDRQGRQLAAATAAGVTCWRRRADGVWAASGEVRREGAVRGLAFDPAGEALALAGPGREVRLLRWAAGALAVRSLGRHRGRVEAVRWLARGALLSTGADGEVLRWTLPRSASAAVRAETVARSPRALRDAVPLDREGRELLLLESARGAIRFGRGKGAWRSAWRRLAGVTAVARRGPRLAAAGRDGAVRTWKIAATRGGKGAVLRSAWRVGAVLRAPAAVWTHRGWAGVAGSVALEPPGAGLLAGAASGFTCRWRSARGGVLEARGEPGGGVRWRRPLPRPRRLIAVATGCLALVGEVAHHFDASGRRRVLGVGVSTLAAAGRRALLGQRQLKLVDLHGGQPRAVQVDVGVSAAALTPAGDVAVGYADGAAQLFGRDLRPTLAVPAAAAGAATATLPGPAGVLFVGHRDGSVRAWQRRGAGAALLLRAKLHGPVTKLVLLQRQRRLLAATEVGDVLTLDVGPLAWSRCALLRRIWREVPVVWGSSIFVRRAPPVHRCVAK